MNTRGEVKHIDVTLNTEIVLTLTIQNKRQYPFKMFSMLVSIANLLSMSTKHILFDFFCATTFETLVNDPTKCMQLSGIYSVTFFQAKLQVKRSETVTCCLTQWQD